MDFPQRRRQKKKKKKKEKFCYKLEKKDVLIQSSPAGNLIVVSGAKGDLTMCKSPLLHQILVLM